MILPDVNVLIYAFRADMPQHRVCPAWLDRVISGDARLGLSPVASSAVARTATDRRIFSRPSTPEDAFWFCDDLLGQPHCEVVEPGERHWAIFRRLCLDTGTAGGRVTGAWFAALAIEWGCEWVTTDRDFGRFPGLRWAGPETI